MSVEQVLARIAQIESALSAPSATAAATATGGAAATPSTGSPTATTSSPGSTATLTATAASATPSAAATTFAGTLETALAPEANATASILGGASSTVPAGQASAGDTVSSALSLDSLFAADPSLASSVSTLGASSSSTTPLSLQSLLAADPSLLTADPSLAGTAATSATTSSGSSAGNQTIVAIARSQVGVTEQPPGSNDSPAIAEYRTATAGAMAGEPWCAYFASWVARQAGEPLGAQGQGFGAVADVWSWAQQTGRAVTNGPGVLPRPGDLIVFGDHHVGIVDQVLPDGNIETVEGNYDDSVSLVTRSPTEATGYVRMS